MIINLNKFNAEIIVNEYITKFSEIKEHIDLILESVTMEEVTISHENCDEWIVRKMVGYIENHDIKVNW